MSAVQQLCTDGEKLMLHEEKCPVDKMKAYFIRFLIGIIGGMISVLCALESFANIYPVLYMNEEKPVSAVTPQKNISFLYP